MKINPSLLSDDFVQRKFLIGDELCTLVFPSSIAAKWNKQNLIFRSSIWNSNWELISGGFKKFFNWGEQPDLCYTPFSLTANGGCQLIEKIDGSTLIVSKYKGELIVRTRGTVDARQMENGFEIDELIKKYPKAFDNKHFDTEQFSFLFEWVTPNNRIVIPYDEPDIYLIGIIDHIDYEMLTQNDCDRFAKEYGLKRPRTYSFNSIKDMINAVEDFKGVEGICVYCNHGQDIRKVKGADYLARHRLKDQLGTFERLVDFYFTQNCPEYSDFFKAVEETVDYETAIECQGDISRICDGMKEVNLIVNHMWKTVQSLKDVTRKRAAIEIQHDYGITNRCSMAFTLLDGKDLKTEQIKKLLYQVIKG